MFENLQDRLNGLFRKMSGQARMTEENIREALREVRVALLEADVNYRAAKEFIKRVEERAVGQEVLKSLTPGQQVIGIVRDELIDLMGGKQPPPELPGGSRQSIMLMGLQGSGKTTTAAKLANFYKEKGRRPLLVAADVYRPAAIDQLKVLGERIGVPVFSLGADADPVEIARQALVHADREVLDVVILDTAGRLHVDDGMMSELERVREIANPFWRLFVADSMTGQDATQQAEEFHSKIGIDGVILTKLDGDTRGGAAISIRAVTGRPILFAGLGEKIEDLEVFHPDRMASRILGMGDVLTLIEKAESMYTEEEAKRLEKKMRAADFDFNDFLDQIQQVRKMGGVRSILAMIPGMSGNKALKDLDLGEREINRCETIVFSMTADERARPTIINGSRRRRIAMGSGTTLQDVNQLISRFDQMRKMMKKVARGAMNQQPQGSAKKRRGKESGGKKNKKKKRFVTFGNN